MSPLRGGLRYAFFAFAGLAMSAPGSSSLGKTVLELTTDAAPLRRGLTEARALTLQQIARIKADSKIQLQVDLAKLRADANAVNAIRRQADAKDLADYRSNLRIKEQENAASLRRMAQEQTAATRRNQALANYYNRPAASSAASGGAGGGAAGLLGLGSGAGAGIALGVGVAAIAGTKKLAESFADLAGQALNYGAALEQTESRIVGYTGSTKALAEAQVIANRAVEQGRGTYSETLSALADLEPLARTYNTNLEDLLKTTQLLAATDPAQGFEGAAVAIREALSGDFTSLVRRFEIPRSEIQKLKDQGVPNLAIVQQALAKLGINDNLLASQANNVSQRIRILKDELLRTIAGALGPLQRLGSDAIAGITRALTSPEVQRAAKQFAADIAPIAADLRRIAADPATQQALKSLALDTLDLASNLHNVAVGAEVALKAITPFLTNVAKGVTAVSYANEQLATTGGLLGRFLDDVAPGAGAVLTLASSIDTLGNALQGLAEKLGSKAGALENLLHLPPGTLQALKETKGGTTAGVAQRVTPARQQDFLPDEGREQDTTANALRNERAAAQGQAALRAYLDGLRGPASLALFDQAEKFLTDRVDDLFSGLTGQGKQQKQSEATVLAARVASDIQQSGKVTQETVAAVGATFGDASPAILAYLTQLASLGAAQERASQSAKTLDEAQRHLNEVTATGAANVRAAQASVEAAQRVADQHADEVRDNVAALQRQEAALADQAAEVARAYDTQIDGLQRQSSALSAQAEEAARASQAKLDALQAERTEIERLTQAHRDEAQAQIDGLREVQNAKSQDETVKALEVKQRADLLALEEKIRAARNKRTPEGEREARALEDQRALVQARGNYALDIARQRAAVGNDQADAAKKPIEDAAAAQAKKDKAAADAIDGRIKATQDEAKAAADDYAARGRAIQAQITALQDEAKNVAADYAARDRAIKSQIDQETERGRILALADKQAIEDAGKRLTIVQAIASAQQGAAQFGVTMAQKAKTLADGELKAQQDLLGVLDQKNQKFGEFVKGWRDLIKDLQAAGVDPRVINAYFGVGTTATPSTFTPSPSHPDVDPPLPDSSGGGLGSAGRGGLTPPQLRYSPPAIPSTSAAYTAGRGAASAASLRTAGGGLTVQGPLVHVETVRETAELGPLVDLAAVKAAQLSSRGRLAAMREDNDGGGAASNWTRG